MGLFDNLRERNTRRLELKATKAKEREKILKRENKALNQIMKTKKLSKKVQEKKLEPFRNLSKKLNNIDSKNQDVKNIDKSKLLNDSKFRI